MEEETQVVLGLPDRLLLVVVALAMAIPVTVAMEVARQEQEPTRRRQQTACPRLFRIISLDQVKTLVSSLWSFWVSWSSRCKDSFFFPTLPFCWPFSWANIIMTI